MNEFLSGVLTATVVFAVFLIAATVFRDVADAENEV